MKTNFFKIVMPAAAILFAIGGSYATKASEKKSLAATNGYITPPGFSMPCPIPVPCSTIPAPLCTAMYQGNVYTAGGKFSSGDTNCVKVVYRP